MCVVGSWDIGVAGTVMGVSWSEEQGEEGADGKWKGGLGASLRPTAQATSYPGLFTTPRTSQGEKTLVLSGHVSQLKFPARGGGVGE